MDTLVETPWGEDSEDEEVVEPSPDVEEIDEISKDDPLEEKEIHDVLALPIRAKPLFLNNEEDVVEFTLSESKDGLESASIIVGEGLFRVVETKMHQDGVPRIDLKMALDSEVTGFQHIVEKPTAIEMGVSGGLLLIGLILCIFPFSFTMILGIATILFGIKFAPNYLERHRLVFSSCGNTHVYEINPIYVFKPTFRASMALIGPALAEYMKTGEIDSSTIDELHLGLRAPSPAHEPLQIAAPPQLNEQMPVGPPALVEIPVASSSPIMETTTPNIQTQTPAEVAPTEGETVIIPAPPQAIPQPNPLPPPQAIPQPNPLPPPQAIPQPNPLPTPQAIPQPTPLPPPPQIVPQPTPLPLPPAMLPSQPSMQGFDTASLPLDAPLPEAPRIPVAAAPQEQTISQEEQDALMDELL
ncbi:MAG: hypothetical protein HOL79_08520 [Euryarchaeota archaeon]|jgi:hypothetical protein|nr:hypothetical protein [Euryarchaeota archaeon]